MKGMHVVMHIGISLDGKVTGFEQDVGTYYQLAETFDPDVTLSGSNTILSADMPEEISDWARETAAQFPSCGRMLMAVVDSRGRVRNWHAIKKQPFWRKAVALCSETTPRGYLDYLKKEGVEYIVAGKDRVDIKRALVEMHSRYGSRRVRVDSGGTLGSVLLREGLVDEISLLVSPCIVGNLSTKSFIEAAGLGLRECVKLELTHCERMEDGGVWLKYAVAKPAKKARKRK